MRALYFSVSEARFFFLWNHINNPYACHWQPSAYFTVKERIHFSWTSCTVSGQNVALSHNGLRLSLLSLLLLSHFNCMSPSELTGSVFLLKPDPLHRHDLHYGKEKKKSKTSEEKNENNLINKCDWCIPGSCLSLLLPWQELPVLSGGVGWGQLGPCRVDWLVGRNTSPTWKAAMLASSTNTKIILKPDRWVTPANQYQRVNLVTCDSITSSQRHISDLKPVKDKEEVCRQESPSCRRRPLDQPRCKSESQVYISQWQNGSWLWGDPILVTDVGWKAAYPSVIQ